MRKNWLFILKWAFVIAYLILVLGFTEKKKSEQICNNLNIIIHGNENFISEEIVENLLITNDINIDSCIIDNLNFDEIEKLIQEHPAVRSAEAFSDFLGNVSIKVIQRNPVLRVITKDNQDFYLDDEYKTMPLADYYTSHVTVLSGNISSEFVNTIISEEDKNHAETKLDNYSMYEILQIFDYIINHSLWKYQITHIYINEKMEIELIPRLGDHLIMMGYPDNFKYKLEKLETLYEQKFNEIDWDSFYKIDLRYSDQVILKKRS